MTRTIISLAAAFSLASLPAAASEIGGEPIVAPSSTVDQAARRGGGRSGGARSGGARSGGARSGGARSSGARNGGGRVAGRNGGAQRSHGRAFAARPAASHPAASRPAAQHNASRSPRQAPRAANSAARTNPRGSSAVRPGAKPGTQHQQAGRPGPRAANVHHSSAVRPGGRPSAHNSAARRGPPRHSVQHRSGLPGRWTPGYHRYGLRGVPHNSPRYWAHGIFIYSPPPARKNVVVVDGNGKRMAGADPSRAVDRNNSFSLGMRGGSYMSGYEDGGNYGDLGLGLALRYRPVESVGLEMSWMHHSDTWDDHAQRTMDPLSASVELFAFPWTRVSPYATVGVTVTPRDITDTYSNGLETVTYQAKDALAGPHAGLGIEFALGQSAALNFEAKYVGYIDRQQGDRAIPGALQGNMGLNFYF